MKSIVNEYAVLALAENKKEPSDLQRLLREQSKLSINDNDLPCRTSNYYYKVILPFGYKEVMQRELRMNKEHLGADRILQLIREKFYWLRMEKEVCYQ